MNKPLILFTATSFLAVLHSSSGLSQPSSIWTHNGSLMSLDLAGGQLQFVYVQPRPGMIDAGARSGSLLFDGRLQGAHISGVARIFSWQCGQFPYQVEGEVSNDGTHITLKGSKPRVERTTCSQKGSTPDVLNFDLQSGAPIAMVATSTDASQPQAPAAPPVFYPDSELKKFANCIDAAAVALATISSEPAQTVVDAAFGECLRERLAFENALERQGVTQPTELVDRLAKGEMRSRLLALVLNARAAARSSGGPPKSEAEKGEPL